MIVYSDPKTTVRISEALRALEELEGRDLLIANGMLEQGIADLGLNEREGLAPEQRIDLKIPEGFAFYQLYPEQYQRAAQRWLREYKPPGEAVVIGLRSIGTSLSQVVSSEIQRAGWKVKRCTVRPEGDPFRRKVRLPEWVSAGANAYLVVDEGPGMSGSSFTSVVEELERLGVERKRIYFFPGHSGEPGIAASEQVRKVWNEVLRWVEPKELPPLEKDKHWEYIGPALPWPFDCSGEAERCARRSAALSYGLPVLEQRDWWLAFPKVRAEPAKINLLILAEHIAAVADDPLSLADEIETERRLRGMLQTNVEKHFKDKILSEKLQRWLDHFILRHGSPSSGDGQLGPANWIRGKDQKLWKLNTRGSKLSHFVAYRLPVLWDVGQAIVEWDLSEHDEETLRRSVAARGLPSERSEVEFFKLAVAAVELGKVVMLGAGDKRKYEARLVREIQAIRNPRQRL
jgi:hypothetical protein